MYNFNTFFEYPLLYHMFHGPILSGTNVALSTKIRSDVLLTGHIIDDITRYKDGEAPNCMIYEVIKAVKIQLDGM
jgi:hypothetical protein